MRLLRPITPMILTASSIVALALGILAMASEARADPSPQAFCPDCGICEPSQQTCINANMLPAVGAHCDCDISICICTKYTKDEDPDEYFCACLYEF
jgi:hypothetical protein